MKNRWSTLTLFTKTEMAYVLSSKELGAEASLEEVIETLYVQRVEATIYMKSSIDELSQCGVPHKIVHPQVFSLVSPTSWPLVARLVGDGTDVILMGLITGASLSPKFDI